MWPRWFHDLKSDGQSEATLEWEGDPTATAFPFKPLLSSKIPVAKLKRASIVSWRAASGDKELGLLAAEIIGCRIVASAQPPHNHLYRFRETAYSVTRDIFGF